MNSLTEKTALLAESLGSIKIIPVIKINRAEDALPLAAALLKAGLPIAEITFRTAAAEQAIKLIRENFPQMLVGAGTVLNPETAQKALNAGAAFALSPGLNTATLKWAADAGLPFIPGVLTPTEIETAMAAGCSLLKLFPAEVSGGSEYIKAVSAPYSGVKFIPTGGITEANIKNYLSLSSVLACGGTWFVKDSMIDSGDFDGIEELARQALLSIKS
jgi:2-dehydro-3-deoxyphosphogluconate aldolase/(4S)-4-hydroxy-2-oxoglutarate aldolase